MGKKYYGVAPEGLNSQTLKDAMAGGPARLVQFSTQEERDEWLNINRFPIPANHKWVKETIREYGPNFDYCYILMSN